MLERIEHDNGVVTYQSPLLRQRGVRHAFSTRIGGISKGNYASLNLGSLGKGAGDANALISENFRRLRAAVGLQRYMRYELKQVHGCGVWTGLPPKPPRPCDVRQADAMVTDLPQRMLTIRTADCVALLLHDGQQIAAAHAGWRGVAAGVVGAVLATMDVSRVVAAVGPAIGVEHFEVGEEVAEAFVSARLDAAVRQDSPRPHIDLPGAVAMQLQRAGVTPDRIDGCDRCTYRDEAEFFSYRRDVTHRGQTTGHMAAVIALDAADATH
ncbi:MAG: laccase domain-containing protein [Phycisphaeraceae bacterium]|nr:laccase domain-containing protein [Phycisphaeraceae bacterium]